MRIFLRFLQSLQANVARNCPVFFSRTIILTAVLKILELFITCLHPDCKQLVVNVIINTINTLSQNTRGNTLNDFGSKQTKNN
jgi:hypothetical protein